MIFNTGNSGEFDFINSNMTVSTYSKIKAKKS